MHPKLADFARTYILTQLNQLEDSHRLMFKKLYSHTDLSAPLEKIVADMDETKLDWAMRQVDNSIVKQSTKS